MNEDTRKGVTEAVECATLAAITGASTPFRRSGSLSPDLAGMTCSFATIGFAGDVRGTMMLIATEEVIRLLTPDDVRDQVTNGAVAEDVLGELANLTVGRLKNALLPRGVAIMLAVPTTGSGSNLRITRTGQSLSAWLNFESLAGALHFRIDVDLSSCPPLRDAETTAAPMTEGELVLF